MDRNKYVNNSVEFFDKLKTNQLTTPNEFTIEMGRLIRKAREDKGISQAEFANMTNRRPATISYIENGKSDISVLTLVLFAINLNKPISYFIPSSLLKEIIGDIQSPFEKELLEYAREIEQIGNPTLTLNIVKVLLEHFQLE